MRPRDLLTDDLLSKLSGARAGSAPERDPGADAAGIARDISKLRAAGYLNMTLPTEFGGLGCTLRQAACAQRRLAYHAPRTAIAVSAHIYWTGAAADAFRAADPSVRWILLEAARGALFAAGHGEPGNDLAVASPKSRCDQAGESGYRFRDPAVLTAVTPEWDWVAVHAVTEDTEPGHETVPACETVLAFAGRGSRCTPAYRVARVLPPGPPADVFTTSAMGWGYALLGSVHYAIARRVFNRALQVAGGRPAQAGGGHPLDQWPVAEASLRLDTIKSRLDEITHHWVAHAGRQADPGGQRLIKVFTIRHEAADSARRVVNLAGQIENPAPVEYAS